MDSAIELANAQAFRDDGMMRVRVFGGLVRHRKIRMEGLAVALAHETGHHLGGPPYLQFYRWLSSEERATDWGLTVGLRKVFGEARSESIAKHGTEQLRAIEAVE